MTFNMCVRANHPPFCRRHYLIFSSKNLGNIESVINNELKHLAQWLRDNKTSLNRIKTELIISSSPSKQGDVSKAASLVSKADIRFNNCKFKLYTHVKYLEILRHFAPLKTCLLVDYSIFYSHLLQDCLAWSYPKEINTDRVNKLQKRCIRILSFSDLVHILLTFSQS